MPRRHASTTLSIIITAHAEGIVLHKTLLSVLRAVEHIDHTYNAELILHIDNPTDVTKDYLRVHADTLRPFTMYTNHFGDAGQSRNFAISKATGQFVTFVDGDDLVSKDWFGRGLDRLAKQTGVHTVVHPESIMEFGSFNGIVKRHDDVSGTDDALLSVYANRWNSIIMASRELLMQEPYIKTPPGYGFEDWHLMNRLIARGVKNEMIPETAVFVRRKDADSRWAAHKHSLSVLSANALLSFPFIRQLESTEPDNMTSPSTILRSGVRHILSTHPRLQRATLTGRDLTRKVRDRLTGNTTPTPTLPEWLVTEWRAIHTIDKSLFPTTDLIHSIPVYDSITPEHWQTGYAYKRLVDRLRFDTYDYLLFTPWLTTGGADKYVIAYANAIQAQRPDKHVVVIATLDHPSPWRDQLAPEVDFLPFGQETVGLTAELRQRLLEQLIENSGASYMHIVNSELAYDFVSSHRAYMAGSGKRLIVTAFSQSIDQSGRVFGYSHTHVPDMYGAASLITSDNQAVLTMWIDEYGFDPAKLRLHRQPVHLSAGPPAIPKRSAGEPLRVLWAARLSPEKLPELLPAIGQELRKSDSIIDIYGTIDPGFSTAFLKQLPPNVTYKGPFDGPSSLPLRHYDVFLYTSLFDGMPNVLLEMGEAGLPIIASDVGGIGELIKHNRTGLLVTDPYDTRAYADALMQLRDHSLRQQLAANLYQEIRSSFSPEAYTKQINEMLQHLHY